MSENPIQRPKIPPQLAMNQMMGTCNQKDKIEKKNQIYMKHKVCIKKCLYRIAR